MTEKQAIEKSIAHWKRMIEWVKTKDQKTLPYIEEMYDSIGEYWGGGFCALCSKYYYYNYENVCPKCPLDKKGYRCSINGSPWKNVTLSTTWGEWLINANKMLEVLKGLS